MKRVLIAASRNWTGVSRLPSTLGPAGFTIDLMDRGGTQASSSRWISKRTAVTGDVSVLVSRLLEVADDYDRVIVCDEPLLNALVDSADNRAHALLPASTDMLAIMLDKTAFPAFLRAVGVCVAPSVVVEAEVGMAVALAEIGLPAYIKGRQGFGGTVVKRVRDEDGARAAVAKYGYPVLVEHAVVAGSCLMPCLFEHGELVAAIAVERTRFAKVNGPSTINEILPVDDRLREMAQAAGRALGLHGFVSIDYLDEGDGSAPIVMEINPRPVPQLHLGTRVGADMAAALMARLEGEPMGDPLLGRAGGTVVLFPQELHRMRTKAGALRGTVRWLRTPGAFADVPWNDLPLAARHLGRIG